MRFATPMYDGDSIIRWGADASPEGPDKADSTPEMLQRKIPLEAPVRVAGPYTAEPFVIDAFEIERRARALRAAAIRSALVSFWSWVERSLEAARRRRVDDYLARAQSVAELEARLRKLEHGGYLVRI